MKLSGLNILKSFSFFSVSLLFLLAVTFPRLSPAQTCTTIAVAGNGTEGSLGDYGPALNAQLGNPVGIALDSDGNIYIGEEHSEESVAIGDIRKVDTHGIITKYAGYLKEPNITFSGGNLIVTDLNNGDGVIKIGNNIKIAGGGTQTEDDVLATGAKLFTPQGIAADSHGNIFIADTINNKVRKVYIKPTDGLYYPLDMYITTVAGTGIAGYSPDIQVAKNSQLRWPTGVAVDGDGNIYIADAGNNRIRKVDMYGTITTIAGNGTPGLSGDGGPAISAELNWPGGIAVGIGGDVYFSDYLNNRIRVITKSDQKINTVVQRTAVGLAFDKSGNLYYADPASDQIGKVVCSYSSGGGSGSSTGGTTLTPTGTFKPPPKSILNQ